LQHICKAHKTHSTEANLAKELQLPTQGRQSFNSGRQNPQPQKEEEKKENRLTAVSFFSLLLINRLQIVLFKNFMIIFVTS